MFLSGEQIMIAMAMSMQVFIVILLTIFSYSGAYVIDKFVISKKAKNSYTYTIVSLSVFWTESIILALFLNWSGISFAQLIKPFIAGLMSGFFYITYFYLLEKEEASQIIPLMYLSPIGLTLIHVLFIKTSFTIYQLLGIVFATGGVIVLESRHTFNQFLKNKTTLLGITYGLLVAIPIAINEVAAHEMPAWNIQPIFATGALIGASFLLFRKDVQKSLLEHFKLMKYTIFSEAFTVMGNIVFWYGLLFLASPILTGINQITPLVLFLATTFISRYYPKIIKEDQHKTTLLRKTIGITLTVIGTGVLVYTI